MFGDWVCGICDILKGQTKNAKSPMQLKEIQAPLSVYLSLYRATETNLDLLYTETILSHLGRSGIDPIESKR
jgi:hypothetical protein